MLFSFKKSEWLGNERNDLFAGLVSSVAILPEVIGFAIIAGVHQPSIKTYYQKKPVFYRSNRQK